MSGLIVRKWFTFWGSNDESSFSSLPFFAPVSDSSLQAYGIGGLRKRQDTASLEDRDKPYVCDSESF